METSHLNTFGLALTLLMVFIVLIVPRKYAALPIIVIASYVTLGQDILVASLHFYLTRILILAGWIRAVIRKEVSLPELTPLDKGVILWVIVSVVIYVYRESSMEALINRSGFAFDALGLYFLFRFLIKDYSDIVRICKMLAIIVMPLAISMLIEKATGRNLFSIFGGVPEISSIRDGRIRCQGSFMHSILAGTFGVTTFFLLAGLASQGKDARKLSILGLISTLVIIITSASSGPVLAFFFGLIAMKMINYRERMRTIRWGIVLSIISLHLIMNAPVWYIFDRISSVTGGTGWYRGELINSFIMHFNEWWLLGTSNTVHWMPFSLTPTMVDITNYYIRNAVDGGLISLVLFISLLVKSFKVLGKSISRPGHEQHATRMLIWSLGVALFAHMISFISVSYFDQIVVFWYLLLAMVSLVGTLALSQDAKKAFALPKENLHVYSGDF